MSNKDPHQLNSGDIPLGVNWTEVANQQAADRARADELLDGITDANDADQARVADELNAITDAHDERQTKIQAASANYDEAQLKVEAGFRDRMEVRARIKEKAPLLGGLASRAYGVAADIGDVMGMTELSVPLRKRAKAGKFLDDNRR